MQVQHGVEDAGCGGQIAESGGHIFFICLRDDTPLPLVAAGEDIMMLFHETSFRTGWAGCSCADGHGVVLETADEAVHVDGPAGHGLPGAALVSVPGRGVASRRVSVVGSACVGRAAVGWTNATGRCVSTQLAFVFAAVEGWADQSGVDESRFHHDARSGGAVLLLAVPRFERS